MDYEKLLISKVAQTGRIGSLQLAGIRPEHFRDEQCGLIYEFMSDHALQYKTSPSFTSIQEQFPHFYFELTTDALDYLKDEFLKLVQYRHAVEAIRDLAGALDDKSQQGKLDEIFLEKSRELSQLLPSARLAKFSDMPSRVDSYETGEATSKGIHMGINAFDELTGGIQAHEYVTIAGWQGTGKSTLGQWMLFNAWMQGLTPMMISLEMESKSLLRKFDTMLMHFKYADLKSGNLREEEIEQWRKKAENVKSLPQDIIILDDVRGCTVDRVYAEMNRYEPNIVCIDYITLMDINRSAGNSMWEKITYITQALKQTARTMGIPIIGIAQTNKDSFNDGAGLENISYSRSIGQDSDIVLGLYNNAEMKNERRMELRLLKNRDGMNTNVDVFWDMETMTFRDPYRDSDAFRRPEDGKEVERVEDRHDA